MAKEFTFDDLNKEMAKNSFLGERLDLSDVSKIEEYIDSGNYHLNACLTGSLFKGYPGNRSICLAGPSGTGKTYLLLNAVKQAQDQGYFIVFYDSENAVDIDLVMKFGIDPTKFRYEPISTVQEFRTSVANMTETLIENKRKGVTIPKILLCLDSAGNLATQKEIDDSLSGSDKADMTRAKVLKSIFRILMTRMAEVKMPFIFTNHTYQTQDLFSRTVSSGGTGIEYAASIILFLSKAQHKEGAEKTGIVVTVKPNKNRFAKPSEIKFIIHFTKGMNRYVGLENYISWDYCGIDKGKIMDEKEMASIERKLEKQTGSKKDTMEELINKVKGTEFPFIQKVIEENDADGTQIEKDVELKFYYISPDDAKTLGVGGASKGLAVKHLARTINPAELFKSHVFTEEVLKGMEPLIREKFEYNTDVLDDEDIFEELEASNTEDNDE